MADFITNTAKMKEMLRTTVEVLKNNPAEDYLTKYVKGKAEVEVANKRGFVVILDFEENGSFAYTNPNGGSLATPYKPTYDRITCNYQYVQVGSEVTNESVVQSAASGSVVGDAAKAAAMKKAAQRMVDMEEFYFCQGDGTQVIARITAPTNTTSLTISGAADGIGAYFLKKGQVVRIYDSTLTTLKGIRTIGAKTTNSGNIPIDSALSVVAGDLVLPEGDAVAPTTTGIKGLPYIAALDNGPYYDKNKTTNPNLAPTVDATAGANSRTRLENLDTRMRNRHGSRPDVVEVTSPAQKSQYMSLFLASPVVHYEGKTRPSADLGLDSWEYTWYGRPIRDFRCLPADKWFKLKLSSLCRVSIGDVGKMLVQPTDYVLKIVSGAYANAMQRWDDEYVEYFSANPADLGALTNLTFTGALTLANDKRV